MEESMLPYISKLSPSKLSTLLLPIKGVIFDVDGTLTIPGLINYKRLRERAHIPVGKDIFPYIRENLKGKEYEEAMQVVVEEELLGQKNVKLQKGADELIHLLNDKGIRVGLLTRNSQMCMEQTMNLFTGHIDLAYCRDIQPSKPYIDPFLRFSKSWNIPCNQLLLAGDHLDDFIASIEIASRSCFVKPPFSTHHVNHINANPLSLDNCQQLPDYIVNYRNTHAEFIPDMITNSIDELYCAWLSI